MKLEDQVTRLELSKRLKELGVKQDSLFFWIEYPQVWNPTTKKHRAVWKLECPPTQTFSLPHISAFTVPELGEMLPEFMYTHRESGGWSVYKYDSKGWDSIDDTEANARANMLIYLLENKMMS